MMCKSSSEMDVVVKEEISKEDTDSGERELDMVLIYIHKEYFDFEL